MHQGVFQSRSAEGLTYIEQQKSMLKAVRN
jgi:hypothetical protein